MALFRKTPDSRATASAELDAARANYTAAFDSGSAAARAAAFARLAAADARFERDVVRGELDGILFDREAGA